MKNHPTAPRQRRCMISGLALLCLVCLRVAAEQLPIKAYGIADGLADNSINRIVKDSHGFLWFCTGEGLARFEGARFVNYGMEHGLAGRNVNDLLETRGGVYWVATSRGLYRFDYQPMNNGKRAPLFVELRLSAAAADQRIQTLFEDSAGTVWCGTANSLYRLAPERDAWRATAVDLPRPLQAPAEIEVRALVEDRRGALWISTVVGLYRLWPDGPIEHFGAREGLAGISNRGPLLVDREGTLWAGTAQGLARLVADPQLGRAAVAQTLTQQDGLASGSVNEIFQAADGRLWVGLDNGLSEGLPASPTAPAARWRTYTKANGLSDARIHALAEDRAGNLWAGSVSSGAMRIAAHGFTTYGKADGLQGPNVISLLNQSAGEFAVVGSDMGTTTTFIHRFDGRRFVGAKLPLPRGSRWSWGWYQTVLQARDGEWWLAMYDGAARYAATNRLEQLARAAPLKIFTKRNGLPGNDIFRLFEDARGDLWFAVLGDAHGALARWERATNATHTYTLADGLPPAGPTAFCEDAAGNLWIGFYDGGVARYRAGRFTLFTHADGLPRGLIRGLFLDHAGALWIATSEGGVARVNEPAADQPRFVTYDRTNGLASNRACCVTEDLQGRLYVGTGRGVDRLDLSEGVTARFTHYTSADGLAAGLVGVCLRDRDGALWFGTAQGVSRLNPQSELFTVAPPPIRIGELEIAGAPRALSALGETAIDEIELEPQQNDLRVGFFSLNFAAGEALRYQTKLINLAGTEETDWSAPSAQSSVNLRLSPGAYRLLARAVGSDGVISPTPATVSFRILRPVWQRWWFLTLIGLGLASLLFTFVRARGPFESSARERRPLSHAGRNRF